MTKQILVFAVSLVILVLSCKKEKTSSGSNTNIATEYPGDKPYSGLWSGTVVEKDSLPSLCRFVESNWKVLQKWLVKGDSVFIDETILLNYETLKYNWKGTIKNDTLDFCPPGISIALVSSRFQKFLLKLLSLLVWIITIFRREPFTLCVFQIAFSY